MPKLGRGGLWFVGHPLADTVNGVLDRVADWPATDLFPEMGIN